MFQFRDFEIAKIEDSTISLFRSHSITVAAGVTHNLIYLHPPPSHTYLTYISQDIRERERLLANLQIFEEGRLYFLGCAEKDLIHECIIGDFP